MQHKHHRYIEMSQIHSYHWKYKIYIQLQLTINTMIKKSTQYANITNFKYYQIQWTCLNWTCLGLTLPFRIDRCSVYAGKYLECKSSYTIYIIDFYSCVFANKMVQTGTQGLKNPLVRGPGLDICGFRPNIF